MKPENVTCPQCNGPMVPRTSQHGKFWGCKAYPKCRGTRNVMGDTNTPRQQDDDWHGGWMADRELPSDRQRGNDKGRWRQ